MTQTIMPPCYHFRPDMPSLWEVFRQGVSDAHSTIPETILSEPAVQLTGGKYGTPLVVSDPELARVILQDREVNFTRHPNMRRLMRRSWGNGIGAAEGEDWRRQRKAATPAFTPAAVQKRIAQFAFASGKAAGDWPLAEQFNLPDLVARIIADIVFTVLVDGGGAVDTRAVADDLPGYINRIAHMDSLDLFPLAEALHDWRAGIAGDPAVRHLRAVAGDLADRRGGGDDMIALLEGVGPLEDNILGLMPAAMDTTVWGTSWVLYTLASRPEWQAKVAQEARDCDGTFTLDRLPVTRRVVQEVLRLYPPAPLVVRAASKQQELGGFRLMKGHTVTISFYAMHRHRKFWNEADTFDPDRFLPERLGNNPAYMPFGTGPRMCIAAQFALAEIIVVVAQLLAELELAVAGAEPQVTLQVTTRSATGLNVVAQRRG
ncbi:MAG: cytochrome P450 [Novosphingobium sp.]|nr:cytochrome P450 [Novosphingobium sp.]